MNMKKLAAVFSESQVMMLVEEFNSELKLVHEGIAALDRKIDDVEIRLTEKIEVVDSKVMGLSKRVDGVEKRLDGVEKRLDGVEKRLSAEIAEVKAEVAAHRDNTELHHAPKKRTLKRA